MHARHGKIILDHFLGQPLDFSLGVTEYDSLCDSQAIIKIAEGIKLPFFFVDSDKELLDAFKSEFISLHQDLYRVVEELLAHFENFLGEGGTHNDSLGLVGKETIDLMDLVPEAFLSLRPLLEHFVRLIQNEHLHFP